MALNQAETFEWLRSRVQELEEEVIKLQLKIAQLQVKPIIASEKKSEEHECDYLYCTVPARPEQPEKGSQSCPICGLTSPHSHSKNVIREYRFAQGVRFDEQCGCCATGSSREPSRILTLSHFPKLESEIKGQWCNCACHDVADYVPARPEQPEGDDKRLAEKAQEVANISEQVYALSEADTKDLAHRIYTALKEVRDLVSRVAAPIDESKCIACGQPVWAHKCSSIPILGRTFHGE